jgi:hypothetical protein
MTFQDWGALGDMVGGAAVVASLIYLAMQIRQNTQQMTQNAKAMRLSAFERNIESANRIREPLILDPDLAGFFLRGLHDYHGLESLEKFRFGLLMRNILAEFQGAFLRHIAVSGDDRELEETARFVDSILINPGARSWLTRNESDWRPEFRAFITARLANLDRQAELASGDKSSARDVAQ